MLYEENERNVAISFAGGNYFDRGLELVFSVERKLAVQLNDVIQQLIDILFVLPFPLPFPLLLHFFLSTGSLLNLSTMNLHLSLWAVISSLEILQSI